MSILHLDEPEVPISDCEGGIVVLKHCSKAWVCCVHRAKSDQVGTYAQTALPLSCHSDFVSFEHNGAEVTWEQVIEAVPVATITFKPTPQLT